MNNFESSSDKNTNETLTDAEIAEILRLQEEEASAIHELAEAQKALAEVIRKNLPQK